MNFYDSVSEETKKINCKIPQGKENVYRENVSNSRTLSLPLHLNKFTNCYSTLL